MRLKRIFLLLVALLFGVAVLPWAGEAADKALPKAKKSSAPKRKGYDYEKSKYKAYRVLTEDESKTYRFDERGNPIPAQSKKKAAKKKPKPRPDEEIDANALLDDKGEKKESENSETADKTDKSEQAPAAAEGKK